MFIIYITYFISYFVLTLSSYPGLTANINSFGLDYLGTVSKQVIERKIPGKHLDDISGEADSPVGKIEFKVYDLTVVSFNLNAPTFNVNHEQLIISFQKIYIFLKGTFQYKSWFAHDHLDFDVYVQDGTVDITLIFGLTPDAHPSVKSSSCIASLGSLVIKFHGGMSWLYDFVIKFVIDDIKRNMEGLICKELTEFANKDLNNMLMELQTLVKLEIGDYPTQSFWWNLSLIEPPVLFNQKILLKSDGHFFINNTNISSYGIRSKKTLFIPTTKMVDFTLPSFTINSLLNLFYRHDMYRSYRMSKFDLPSNYTYLFNTTCENAICIGCFIPQLAKFYPSKSIKTNLSLVEPIKVELMDDHQAHLIFYVNLDVYVTNCNSSAEPSSAKDQFVFSLFSSTNYSLHFDVIHDVLKGKISNITSSNHVTNSKIGHLSDRQMDYFFDVLNQNVIIKKINVNLYENGLPIPDSKHIINVKPIFYLFENTLQLSMDFIYLP